MYCIKCGVKLADSEKECPLCATRVFHPDLPLPQGESPYPHAQYPAPKPRTWVAQIVMTAIFLLPMLIVPLCDLQLTGSISWSGYVLGALLLGYIVLILPTWFKRPNPVIFVPIDFAAIGAYLLYINHATGGQWFLTFALPVTGGICLIVTAVITLMRYIPRGGLYILGGAGIALGGLMLLFEFLANLTFGIPQFMGWSLYPLIALVILGGLLIFLAVCRPARETLERKIFI